MNDYTIEAASSADEAAILNLLTATDLPRDGAAEHLGGFLVARDASGRAIACAGLERHGNIGLLRSVAVAPDSQKSGLGSRLVWEIIERARRNGIAEIVLLTTTARKFFGERFGFVETNRNQYNDDLKNSPEWTLPRCSAAAAMKLDLRESKLPV